MRKEIWKDIPGYDGDYQASDFGRVKSVDKVIQQLSRTNKSIMTYTRKGKILKPTVAGKCKYLKLVLRKDGKSHSVMIHRIIAETFIPNPNNLPEVNHINEDKTDNRVENLEWCDRKYNVNYGTGIERQVEKRSKPVLQFTRDGKFVREWPSTNECGRCGFDQPNVAACCRGERKKHRGYIWQYKD